MVDFVRACLHIDPSTRMQAEEALRHPWFRELLIQSEIEIDHREIEEQTTPNKGIKQQRAKASNFAVMQSAP